MESILMVYDDNLLSRAGYIMPRPVGAISPEELYQVAKMFQSSDMFTADRKELLSHMYLDGCVEMGVCFCTCSTVLEWF